MGIWIALPEMAETEQIQVKLSHSLFKAIQGCRTECFQLLTPPEQAIAQQRSRSILIQSIT
eukprot:216557-Amphidinium_carterae.1